MSHALSVLERIANKRFGSSNIFIMRWLLHFLWRVRTCLPTLLNEMMPLLIKVLSCKDWTSWLLPSSHQVRTNLADKPQRGHLVRRFTGYEQAAKALD
ncbi:MAG: hypothetical protein AAF267_08180 [Deinococcota bacterium]